MIPALRGYRFSGVPNLWKQLIFASNHGVSGFFLEIGVDDVDGSRGQVRARGTLFDDHADCDFRLVVGRETDEYAVIRNAPA